MRESIIPTTRDLIALLRRAAAAHETPGDLSPADVEALVEDLVIAADNLELQHGPTFTVTPNRTED